MEKSPAVAEVGRPDAWMPDRMDRRILGETSRRGLVTLDPRTLMGLLAVASVLAFMPKSQATELMLVGAVALLQMLCGHVRMGVGYLVGFGVLWAILNWVFPFVSGMIATMFTISLTYARKIYLCLMVGTLLVSETSVHRLAAALQRLHTPALILIPLTVTMRYFPTLKDEASHIRDAMRLRDIPVAERLECLVVPLIMSATNTADELSRSATCRGIENPALSTDTERLRMRGVDWACLACGVLAIVAVAVGGGL